MSNLPESRRDIVEPWTAIDFDLHRCPECGEVLEERSGGVRCSRPTCGQAVRYCCGIPALFRDPELHIAMALSAAHRATNWLSKAIKQLGDISQRESVVEGFKVNRTLFERWSSEIALDTSPIAVLELDRRQPPATSYGSVPGYLLRDWTDLAVMVADRRPVLEMLEAARPHLAPGRALMLGAGVGRFAMEVADWFTTVNCLELSLTQILMYREVRRGPVDVALVETKNARTAADMVAQGTAAIPEHLRDRSRRVHYTWAKAPEAPMANGAFDSVLSVYFTELVDLDGLIEGVLRWLRPGGTFVHLGPLDYHHTDRSRHHSFEEMRGRFVRAGFEVTYEDEAGFPEWPGSSLRRPWNYRTPLLVLSKRG